MIDNYTGYILDVEGARDVVDPPELETEHGREHYRLLMACYDLQGYQRMIDRLNRVLDECGVPGDDFESKAVYAAGFFKVMKNENKRTD